MDEPEGNCETVNRSIDTTPPDTSITSGPDYLTNDNTRTFSFSGWNDLSPESNLLYSYTFDSGEWSVNSRNGSSVSNPLGSGCERRGSVVVWIPDSEVIKSSRA